MIGISLDARRTRGKIGYLQSELSPKQVAGVLNNVLKSTRTYSSRLARGVVNLKAKDVVQDSSKNTRGDMIHMYRTSGEKLAANLYFTSHEYNISKFGAKQSRKGVSVTTWRGLGREYIHHAWQKKLGNSWYKRAGSKRIPYAGLKGPSMVEVMSKAVDVVMKFATKRMEVELLRRVRAKLRRG